MPSFIPFVSSRKDCAPLSEHYGDADIVRVSVYDFKRVRSGLPETARVWLDPAIDGVHELLTGGKRDTAWKDWLNTRVRAAKLIDSSFVKDPSKEAAGGITVACLDACASANPAYISVPQLPSIDDASRNKLNRLMAQAAEQWFSHGTHRPKSVFPVVFTDQCQTVPKQNRDKKLRTAIEAFEASGAQWLWVADVSLDDAAATTTVRDRRIPAMLVFLENLRKALAQQTRVIIGPFWGLNLLAWARGLADTVALTPGGSYRYYLSGGFPRKPAHRVAVEPIRQQVIVTPGLRRWVKQICSLERLDPLLRNYFRDLQSEPAILRSEDAGRMQVAEFYRKWFDRLEGASKEMRAMSLFQDFTSAFAIGQGLPRIHGVTGAAGSPGRVAEAFMMNCISDPNVQLRRR